MMIIGAVSLALTHPAAAQDDAALQQAQAECQSTAQQQTGYNPNAAPATTTTQPQAGGRARGAAAGAMAGAVMGKSRTRDYDNLSNEAAEEYTKNRMEDAAKAGAAVGASRQRQDRRQGRKAEQQQTSAANAYNQAYAACMTSKGFPGQ